MRKVALIIGMGLAYLSASNAMGSSGTTIVLNVTEGDTAFAVDMPNRKAWWLKSECRVALPIDAGQSSDTLLVSQPQTETVSLGQSRIRLKQQFRFDLSGEPAKVSIFSSVRGGWAAVPVERDSACQNGACRQRTELPEC